MFKHLIIYRIAPNWAAGADTVEEALAKAPFQECGATQEKSFGWIPPRGEENGALVEAVAGQWILKFKSERKTLPSAVINKRVKEKAARIEKETSRKPGKKETKDLKEEAKLELLPMAFTAEAATTVWIDHRERWLVLDTGSQARADEIVSLLVESLQGLSVSLLYTETSPQSMMTHWLVSQEPPVGFTVDRECELKSADEAKAVVRYSRHPLDLVEIRDHIAQGKLPTRIALTWDDRVSFVLTEGLQVRGVKFLDTVFEGTKADYAGFDADVTIATGELAKLIPDLIEALGGESAGIGAATSTPAPGSAERVVAIPAGDGSEGDVMYPLAVDVVRGPDGKASVSYVQRKLRIGYNRAARMLEAMEGQGLVSAMDSAGMRRVL